MITQKLIHHSRETLFSYCVPEGKGPFPAVVFSHGYNGCMTDFDALRAILLKNGIASAALTFSGGSTRDESGFPSTSMTLETEKEDLFSLIEWIGKKDEICKNKLFLFGASMGGLISCMAASEIEKNITALILLFPALCIVDDWNERFKDPSEIPEKMMFWNLLLGRDFFLSMRSMDTFDMLSKLSVSTQIFHGDKDPIVPLAYSQKAIQTMKNANLTVFEGEGHGFSADGNQKMENLTVQFIKSNL